MPSSTSRRPCGRISTRRRSTRRSPRIAAASAASDGPASKWREPSAPRSPERVLVTRIATAAALVAGLLAALFFLPRNGLAVVVALLLGFGGHEWGRLCRLSSGLALAYAATVVAVFLV